MADKSEAVLDGKALHSLRVVDLRSALEKRGLPKSGSKKELVERLKLQLKIEKLHEESVKAEDRVPNLDLQDELTGQNDFVRQYLAAQQQTYALQLKERRQAEMQAFSSAPEKVGGEEAAAAPVVLSPAVDEKSSHQGSWERPRRGRTCPSSIDPGGNASHCPYQGKLPVEANTAVDTCRRSRLRQQRLSPPCPAKKGRMKSAGTGEQEQSCQPQPEFSSTQNECSMHDMVQRTVQSPRKGAVAPAVSPPPIEERKDHRYPSRRKREKSVSKEIVTASQPGCTEAITSDEKGVCDVEACQATPASRQDKTAEETECVREKHARLEDPSPGLVTAHRSPRKKNKRKSSTAMATNAESSPLDSSQLTLPEHLPGADQLAIERTSNPIQCSVVDGSEKRGKPLRMLITRTGATKSVISCNRVNTRCEPLPENAAACHLNTSTTQVPCNVLPSEPALKSSALKDSQPDTQDTQSSSRLLEVQVGDDLHETLNKLHITEAESRKQTMETDGGKESLSSVQCDTIPVCATPERSATSLVEQEWKEDLNKDSVTGNHDANTAVNTSSENKNLQPEAAIIKDVEQKALEQDVNASSTSPAGHNTPSTSSMPADASSSPTRPSVRRPLTLEEMTSAVESILQTTEQTMALTEQCQDMPDTDANLIDEKEVDNATDSLLKEMSVHNEDNLQLTTPCLSAQQVKIAEFSTSTTLHKDYISSDEKRGCGTEEISVKSATEAPYNVLAQSEPAMFETQSSISQNEELFCTTILPTDGTGVLSGASLTEGKVLDEGAQVSAPNSSSSPQCFDAVGLDTVVKKTKPCTTPENDKHQQKISEQSTSTASRTSPPTECLEDMDTERSYEHTRLTCTFTEASKNDSMQETLNSDPSQLLSSKIPVQVLENDQNVKTDHAVQKIGDKSSLQETSFYQETFQPLHKTQAKDDSQKALARHESSRCLHSACEDKDTPGSLECAPPLETRSKQSAGVEELCSDLPSPSLHILEDTHKLHADIAEEGASLEKQLNTPDLSLSQTNLETFSCSGDDAPNSADTLETSPQEEPCKEERIINTQEVLPCSRGSDNTDTIKSPCDTLCNTEPEESKKMNTSSFLPKLLSSSSEECTDNSKQLDLSRVSLDADTPVMLPPNKNAAIKSDNKCSSYFLEEQSITGSGSNEGLQNEGTKTKATANALSTVPNEEKKPAKETTTDSLKTQECTENTIHEINEKAGMVTGDAACTISNAGNTDEPRKKDVLHFPQDEVGLREVPQEMSLQCYTSPVNEPADKDTMSTYATNQDSDLTSCKFPMLEDKHNSEAHPDFALDKATGVNLDNSNDAVNPKVSDSAITSSMPVSVVSSGSLTNTHKQNEEAQAVSTVPSSLSAGFTVTQQQQHQQHQDASSLGSCDSTTESCNILQHPTALSIKECPVICPDDNLATSWSAKGQRYDGSVLAPDSTIIECGALPHSSSPKTANLMGSVQPNSSMGIQDTKEMPAFVIPCSNTHKSGAICQFSRPHENDGIPSKSMQGDQQMQTTQGGRAARKEIKDNTSVSGEIMDSSDAMKSRSPVRCACDDFNPAERKLENKDNFDNSRVSAVCSEEANLAITGEPFTTTAEMKEDVKNAAAEHKQSVMTAHEVSSELENTDKIEVTDRTCTISPSEILLQKHENVDETKNEAMAANTQMIMLLSNRANATSDELLVDENDSCQREKCSSHDNQNKQEVGGNLHLCGTSSKHPPSTKSVITNAHAVHEASAMSQDFSQECTNISIPEHSEELGTDARHEQESVKELESIKFGGLQQVGTEEPSNNKLDVTGSTNISVKARYAIEEGAETICVPHSSTLKNENASEHSNLSSVVPEDGIRSQDAETTLTSANMEQANVKGNDDSNAFYSPSETCFTGLYATPEPSNMEPTPTAFEHKEKYANRTNSEFAHSPTGLSRSTAQVEYSIAAHAVLHISGTERTVNFAHMDISDSDQAVEKHTPRIAESDFSTDEEHVGRSEEIVNSSSNFAVNDELVLGFTAENRQHCAPILAENIPKDLEIQGKEHILSPSNCAAGNDNSAIYDSKRTKEDSVQMDATTCTEQHGADLAGADGVDTDVAATGSMEFPSCSKSHAGTAASNSCGAYSFNNAASPTRNVERQCSVSRNNFESQPHEACDPLQQICGKSDASAGLQHKTRETGRYVLGRVDTSDSSGDTSCSESEEHEMARLRGRGVRKQVPARATKESSEASSDGEGSEAGNRRLRNGRRATPEEPQAMRRSSRNRKAAAEESPKEDSDAATEPESTPGSPQLEEGQVLSPVNEEEEQKPEGKEASEGSSSSSSSESSDTSDGEEEPVGRRGLKGVLASPPGRRQAPSEGPHSPPNSEPAQEEDVKSQEEPAETKTVEPDQHPPQEERPPKESVPEDVEMKDDEESQQASGASPPKFKTRRLSIAALKKDSEDKEERPQRKRKWGPMNVVLGPSMSISTAALKDLIPDIQEPLSKPKELEEEHVTASVGESPVTEQEEASDEPPVKLQAVDDEPTSEEMPPCNDNTEKDQEKGEDGEPSHGEKSSRGDRIDKASRDEKPNDDRLPRSERFSRDEKEKPPSRDEKTSKTDKPPREVSRDDKPGRHDANTKETKGARERASPITAPSAERKALHVISDRAPLSKRPAAGKDEAGQRKLASPPRNPKSRILFVRNLVRPFTLNQLKQLLQEFGDTVDSEFWIDKIKSKCFVTYVSEEDAVKAREALHNLRWPLCNPKILHVDFSSPEEMERQKEPPTPPPPRPAAAATERTLPAFQRTVEVDTRMPTGREVLRDPREVLRDPREPREIKDPREPKDPREARGTVSGPPARPDRNLMVERQAVNRRPALPVREWDRDKLRQETPPPPPAERAPAPSRNRATSPPDKRERRDKKVAKRKSEEDTPAKLLDDLFRKTKASPCIYWLPLTEEQIARKEEERKQRRQERERRRQQQQLQEEEERRKRALARDMAAKTKQESKRSGSHSPVRRR